MHLSKMNRLHRVYTTVTFGQAGIKSYLPPHPLGKFKTWGASCSKIKLAPWASVEEILMSTPEIWKFSNSRADNSNSSGQIRSTIKLIRDLMVTYILTKFGADWSIFVDARV